MSAPDFRDQLWTAIATVRDASPRLPGHPNAEEVVDALAPLFRVLDAACAVVDVSNRMGDDFTADTVAVHVLRDRLDVLGGQIGPPTQEDAR